ncbi:hypothetical protein BS47DRAFT_1295542, partial [Hydnum rufescens UP504]
LFYAYAKHSTTDWAWRYLIVFVDRGTADEWWRAVLDSVVSGYHRFSNVKRVSPQFYTHNPDVYDGNISKTLNDDKCAKRFLGRVIFTLLNDRDARVFPIIPPVNYTDHISGRAYFIRSTLRPNEYWHYDGKNIVVSSTHHTKFTVSARSANYPRGGDDDLVIIGRDDVVIGVKNTDIFVNTTPIKFAQFDGGFSVGNGGELIHNPLGDGDRWELV